MGNGLITFHVDGVSHTLYFGMVATQIFAEKGMQEQVWLKDRGEDRADDVKAFACIVYAGACNYADRIDVQRPTFEACYNLTESILMEGTELQDQIFTCFRESRPTQAMYDKLGAGDGEKKSPQNGKKSKRLRSVS